MLRTIPANNTERETKVPNFLISTSMEVAMENTTNVHIHNNPMTTAGPAAFSYVLSVRNQDSKTPFTLRKNNEHFISKLITIKYTSVKNVELYSDKHSFAWDKDPNVPILKWNPGQDFTFTFRTISVG